MILLKLSRLLIANNMEVNRRLMFVSHRGYRLWANYEIPVQSFGKLHRQEKLDKEMILAKNQLFRKIRYSCMYNQTCGKHFRLMKDKKPGDNFFQLIFGVIKLKLFDRTFKISEFVENCQQSLSIVSNKIAEEKFSDLNELLTPECLSTVKDNVVKLNSLEKSLFTIDENMFIKSRVNKIYIDPDPTFGGKQSEETTVTISIVSLCASLSGLDSRTQCKLLQKCYHTEFQRLYRNNAKGNWIISDIDMHCKLTTI